MANVKISILTEFLGKGIKDANKSVKGLERSVKNLGYIFGGGYLGAKVLAFSKDAVKAFAADDKAAQTLTRTLKNLGLSFEDVRVSNFISDMEQTFGVLDDQLRPAFQKLLTTTGSVSEAQKALKTALNLSAASGDDVVTISEALSKAYVGQTRGLAKYGLGLTQAQLKAMSFQEVQSRINKLFGGQAALATETYSGKIDKLTVAADRAKETIGKGLVDALAKAFGGGTGNKIDNTAKKIEKLGVISSAVINTLADVFQATFDPKAYFAQATSGKPSDKNAIIPSIANELRTKAFEDRMKLLREEAKTTNAITKDKQKQLMLEKAKLALTKAAANFDITKIQLAAALKGKVSEEDRKRLLTLQAIENDNGELALKYISELDFARKQAAEAEESRLKALADAEMKRQNALLAAVQARIDAVQSMIDKVQRKIEYNAAQALADVMSANAAASSGVAGYSGVGSGAYDVVTNPYAGTYYGSTGRDPMPVQVNVALDGQVFNRAVVDAVNQASASGTQLSYTQTATR
jgi:hypothetical protein